MTEEMVELLLAEVTRLREDMKGLAIKVAVLENTWALALKWGAGAGAAVAVVAAVLKEVL